MQHHNQPPVDIKDIPSPIQQEILRKAREDEDRPWVQHLIQHNQSMNQVYPAYRMQYDMMTGMTNELGTNLNEWDMNDLTTYLTMYENWKVLNQELNEHIEQQNIARRALGSSRLTEAIIARNLGTAPLP